MPGEKKFERIIIHCSDSEFGTAVMIAEWHKERGWKTIGYHEVIQNGYPTKSWFDHRKKIPYLVGAVEIGRPIDDDELFEESEMGAHVSGHNTGSYGICIIGGVDFSNEVMNAALDVVRYRLIQFGLKPSKDTVLGHCELDPMKSCPNIYMPAFRDHLIQGTYYGQIKPAEPGDESKPKENIEAPKNFLARIMERIFK